MKCLNYLFLLIFSLVFACYSEKQPRSTQSIPSQQPTIVNLDLDKIKKRGKIIALTDYNSTGYFIYKGQPMGYQYEMLKRLSRRLGVRLEVIVKTDVKEGQQMLNEGKCDILAYSLFVNKKGSQSLAYTEHHNMSRQVLVQRKPQGWRAMTALNINNLLIRNPFGLIEKEVMVRKGFFHDTRLEHLADEIGGEINVKEADSEENTEDLIKHVARGDIDYTIADEQIAKVLGKFYDNLDVSTSISFTQKISWAVRKNSPLLLAETNKWLKEIKRTNEYYAVYDKYFQSSKAYRKRVTSPYFSLNNRLSPFDQLIKENAERIGWDWRLLASLVYQESKFNPDAHSSAGAAGLMQLMPQTAKRFGATNLALAEESIKAGTVYLQYLDRFWRKKIPGKSERLKFILASYNVGQGHVLDAYKLTAKYAKNKGLWDENVASFLLQKSTPKYYRDPIVKSGYCRGREPVKYVIEIIQRYEHYKNLIKE